MLRNSLLTIAALCLLLTAQAQSAQPKAWTLQECIAYAVENNISVQQTALQMENNEVQLNTLRNSRLPSLGASMGGNINFGRGTGRDGVTRDQSTFSSSVGASTGITVFGGMRIKHSIAASKLNLKASLSDMEKAAEDVSLAVTSQYLQVLYNSEMVAVAERQVQISQQLVETNQKKLEARKIAEADLVENRSQLARDQYSLIQQQNSYDLALVDLKQMLNLPSETPFDVALPKADQIALPQTSAAETIEGLYETAEIGRPSIEAAKFRLEASKANTKVAKSQYYPQISASAGYSNGYYNSFAENASNASLRQQFKNNGSESIGMSMSIPIFNKNATRNSVRTARLSEQSQALALDQTRLTLRKEIEQAYHRAKAAYGQYASSYEAAEAASKSFGYEQVRTEAGTSTPYNYDQAKSRLEDAESQMVRAKYEFIFSTKVLEFYKGLPLAFDY